MYRSNSSRIRKQSQGMLYATFRKHWRIFIDFARAILQSLAIEHKCDQFLTLT